MREARGCGSSELEVPQQLDRSDALNPVWLFEIKEVPVLGCQENGTGGYRGGDQHIVLGITAPAGWVKGKRRRRISATTALYSSRISRRTAVLKRRSASPARTRRAVLRGQKMASTTTFVPRTTIMRALWLVDAVADRQPRNDSDPDSETRWGQRGARTDTSGNEVDGTLRAGKSAKE